MITPEQIKDWAQDADEGEDVALDGDTLREIAEEMERRSADSLNVAVSVEPMRE